MLRRPRTRPRRFWSWKKRRRHVPRGVLLLGVLLVLLGVWLYDPDALTQATDRVPITTTEYVAPHNLSVIDGDTVRHAGQRIRLIGYDTPETYRAECDSERKRGDAATAHLGELLRVASSAELSYLPRQDKFERRLARLTIDGRDVADIMVSEDLARRYSGGQRQSWC